ncbi:MAG: S8 family serine peptidase, partial [Candidatus Poseidoniales archaeon]
AWGLADGTSAATVYVTGALALLVEHHPELKANEPTSSADTVQTVKQWLMDAAVPQEGQTGHDDQYGYGLLNVSGLIDLATQA